VLTKNAVLVASIDVAADDGIRFCSMSVLLPVDLTLRTCAHSRAALQLEILALRHQLQVTRRTGCDSPRSTGVSGP
jgi:hypothetical protein